MRTKEARRVSETLWQEMQEYGISMAMVHRQTQREKLGKNEKGFNYRYVQMVISLRTRYNADIERIANNLIEAVKSAYELAA